MKQSRHMWHTVWRTELLQHIFEIIKKITDILGLVQTSNFRQVKSNQISKVYHNLTQVWRLNQITKSVSSLIQVYDAIMDFATKARHSDVKFLLSQTHVKFNSQRPQPHFQVFGLHFTAFQYLLFILCNGLVMRTVLCLLFLQFSIMARTGLILFSLYTVGHQNSKGLVFMPPCFDLNRVLPLVKQLWVTFCDGFEK